MTTMPPHLAGDPRGDEHRGTSLTRLVGSYSGGTAVKRPCFVGVDDAALKGVAEPPARAPTDAIAP
jgi:hypothetical protein